MIKFNTMKKQKIVFWTTTGLFALSMLISANMYLTNEEVKIGFLTHLGIPDYLRIELAVAKILGSLTLILPFVPREFKFFAYAGFAINLISASVAHIALGDPIGEVIKPMLFLALLIASFLYYNKLYNSNEKYDTAKN